MPFEGTAFANFAIPAGSRKAYPRERSSEAQVVPAGPPAWGTESPQLGRAWLAYDVPEESGAGGPRFGFPPEFICGTHPAKGRKRGKGGRRLRSKSLFLKVLAIVAVVALLGVACKKNNPTPGGSTAATSGASGSTSTSGASGGQTTAAQKVDVTVYAQGAWTGPYN